jgi:hypothetical protein
VADEPAILFVSAQPAREVPVLAGDTGELNPLLAAIAESYGINLVADGYRHQRRSLPALPLGEERSLGDVLDQYVSPNARWCLVRSRAGGDPCGVFLQVRRHTWYADRLAEIPDRIARCWATHLRTWGRFSLPDTATLALTLRDEQLAQFEEVMQELGIDVHLPFSDREDASARQQRAILRAYGSLLPGQRRLLGAGGWISDAAMPPAARGWLGVALTAVDREGSGAGLLPDRPDLTGAPPRRGISSGALPLGLLQPAVEEEEVSFPTAASSARVSGGEELLFHYQAPGSDAASIAVSLPVVTQTGASADEAGEGGEAPAHIPPRRISRRRQHEAAAALFGADASRRTELDNGGGS